MKSVVIVETNHLAYALMDMLNPKYMQVVGIANTDSKTWNVFEDENHSKLKEDITGLPIMPIDLACASEPDIMVIAADTQTSSDALKYMVLRAGYYGDIIFINDINQQLSLTSCALRRICRRINELNIEGSIAELGCNCGDTSWQLNALNSERKLYLFDTFDGFDAKDIMIEEKHQYSNAKVNDQKFDNIDKLKARLPYIDKVIIKKGWFPETAFDLEDEKYALVVIDTNLYQPTYSGVEYFYPRLSKGGIIIVKDYEDTRYPGVYEAIADLESKYGAFLITPICDIKHSIMIIKP